MKRLTKASFGFVQVRIMLYRPKWMRSERVLNVKLLLKRVSVQVVGLVCSYEWFKPAPIC